MPRLLERDRGRAVDLLMQGFSQLRVARQLGVAQSTVSRLRQRIRATCRLLDRPRSGRPHETTRRQDRAIRLEHLRDQFRTTVETAANTPIRHNNMIHPKTVRNHLKEVGVYARRPYVGQRLTQIRRQKRRDWLRRHSLCQFPMHRWRRPVKLRVQVHSLPCWLTKTRLSTSGRTIHGRLQASGKLTDLVAAR